MAQCHTSTSMPLQASASSSFSAQRQAWPTRQHVPHLHPSAARQLLSSAAGPSTAARRAPRLRAAAVDSLQSSGAAAPAGELAGQDTSAAAVQLPVVDEDYLGGGELVEVDSLKGVRVLQGDNGQPDVQYLVSWKDGSPYTWEKARNIADDILRQFEDKWWQACRKGDEETVRSMLAGGAQVLSMTLNKELRSALHFTAATGNARLTQLLCDAGADPDLRDKEGYTPLHMAAGYLHTATCGVLLGAGADPELEDREGRTVPGLLADLRDKTPVHPSTMASRVALEAVAQLVSDAMYDEVPVARILDAREVPAEPAAAEEGDKDKESSAEEEKEKESPTEASSAGDKAESPTADSAEDAAPDAAGAKDKADAEEAGEKPKLKREFLLQWADGTEPSWVAQSDVAADLVADWDAGMEYAEAECILRMQRRGDARRYLVRWKDGYEDTWEPEEHVSPDLITLWEAQQASAAQQKGATGQHAAQQPEADSSSRGANGAASTRAVQSAEPVAA